MAKQRLKVILSANRHQREEMAPFIEQSCEVITVGPELTGQLIRHEAQNDQIDGVLIFADDTDEGTIVLAKYVDTRCIPYMLALKRCTSAQVLFELASRDFILVSRDIAQIKTIVSRFLSSLVTPQNELSNGKSVPSHLSGDIWVRQGYADRKVSLDDIRSITAEKDYVIIELPNSSLLVRATLASLEDELKTRDFIRIHRSHIIPARRIRELKNSTRHSHQVELDDGEVFPVGKTYWTQLRTRFRGQILHNAG